MTTTTTIRAGAPIRRIAISTGGGDAPGLNAVIRAVTIAGLRRGWEVLGIRDGYDGLLMPERFGGRGVLVLDRDIVRGVTHLGGTLLGTTNRGNPLRFPTTNADGSIVEVDRGDELLRAFAAQGIDALIAVGGDGSLAIAHELSKRGMPTIGVPKTIDNDLDGTVVTFGFDTAVNFATECLDRLHTTAESHHRVMVVEMMGRYAGWIALHAGIAGSADVILLPEIPYDPERVAAKVEARAHDGRTSSVVVVAEGARPLAGDRVVLASAVAGTVERLGGIGERVANDIARRTGRETRTVVLGHLLRGGTPSAFDRLIALRFGAAAVRALDEGHRDVLVALAPPNVKYVPLADATRRMKCVPLSCDTIATARDLGICLGDA